MPKGNPNPKHRFTTDRLDPLVAKLTVRISDRMMAEIKAKENPNEYVRQAIQEKLDRDG